MAFNLINPIVRLSEDGFQLVITDITDYNGLSPEYLIVEDNPYINSSGRGVRMFLVTNPDGSQKLYTNTLRINKVEPALLSTAILIDEPKDENNKDFTFNHVMCGRGDYNVRLIFAPLLTELVEPPGASNYLIGDVCVFAAQFEEFFQWFIAVVDYPTRPFDVPTEFDYLAPLVTYFDSTFSDVPSVANLDTDFNTDQSTVYQTYFEKESITCPDLFIKDSSRYQSTGTHRLIDFTDGLSELIIVDTETLVVDVDSGFTSQVIEFLLPVREITFVNVPFPRGGGNLYYFNECVFSGGEIHRCVSDGVIYDSLSPDWEVISQDALPFMYVYTERVYSFCSYKDCIDEIVCVGGEGCNCHSISDKDLHIKLLALISFYTETLREETIDCVIPKIDRAFNIIKKICLCQSL